MKKKIRTFVNVVSKPKVETVVMPKDKPDECRTLHFIECSCWQGNTYKATAEARKRWKKIEREFTAVEEEVARSTIWRGLNDFAVVYQTWSTEISVIFLKKSFSMKITLLILIFDS